MRKHRSSTCNTNNNIFLTHGLRHSPIAIDVLLRQLDNICLMSLSPKEPLRRAHRNNSSLRGGKTERTVLSACPERVIEGERTDQVHHVRVKECCVRRTRNESPDWCANPRSTVLTWWRKDDEKWTDRLLTKYPHPPKMSSQQGDCSHMHCRWNPCKHGVVPVSHVCIRSPTYACQIDLSVRISALPS